MKSLGSLRLQTFDESEINKCTNVEHRFVCMLCIEICPTTEDLKRHYIENHGYQSQPLKVCSICHCGFKSSKTLSRHVKTVHYKLKAFNCSVCSKQFSRKATLDIHLRQHLSDETAKALSCPAENCQFRTADPSVMSKHRKLHQKTDEGKYKCTDKNCSYVSIQATGLKNHMTSKHPELFAKMKCTYKPCEFVSVNPERLRRHLNDHEKGLLAKKEEIRREHEVQKALNSSMEISSDCSLPVESHPETGGVTIAHNNSLSNHVDFEDAVF